MTVQVVGVDDRYRVASSYAARFYVVTFDLFVRGGSVPRHSWYSRPFGVTVIIFDTPSYVTKWCASNALIIACRSLAEGTIGKKNES